jgi:two-component system response regulator FixJ
MTPPSLTVHVIDDDDAVRDSLGALLESDGLVAHLHASAAEFLEGLAAIDGGCVVTDIRMPRMTGLELLRELRARGVDLPVIVLTGQADVAMAVEALKGGAADFIEKPFDEEVILNAIRKALTQLAEATATNSQRAEAAERLSGLTGREREVLSGLVAGQSNKEIAIDLGISPRTVEVYRANIMGKARASSLSEVVRLSLQAEAV